METCVFEPVGPECLVLIVTKPDTWESSPDSPQGRAMCEL